MSRRRILVCLIPLALAACGGLFQTKAPPPTIYQLTAAAVAPATAPAVEQIAADLAVLKPRVRTGLATDRIAALYPDRRLEYFADARWSGPVDEVMQDLAVQQFHSSSGLRNVSADESEFPSTYWLEIEVSDFQAEYSAAAAPPTVHVHFLARIGSSADRRIIAQFEASATEAAEANRMSAIVDAYDRAADEALGEIVAGTVRALGRAH
jgi:ABC-type uncharacterized transport system auxiliary subunit